MCNFQQLYFSESGYVIRCRSCDTYQVCFLSTLISLCPEEYAALRDLVCQKIEEGCYHAGERMDPVPVPTPSRSVHFLLSPHELLLLYTMLEEADTEEKTCSLIALFDE